MLSAIKQATLFVIQSYETHFYQSASEHIEYGRYVRDLCGPVDMDAKPDTKNTSLPNISDERATEILQLQVWIKDDSIDDVAFQKLLSNHVNNVMGSGFSMLGLFQVDVWPDKLMKGLRKLLATPAFQADNLRLVQEAKKSKSVSDVPLSNATLQKGLLHEKEARIAQLEIEAEVLRERNHGLFDVNRDLSKTLGIKPVTIAEIDAKQLAKKSKGSAQAPNVNAKEEIEPEVQRNATPVIEKKSTPTVTRASLNQAATFFDAAKTASNAATTAASVVNVASKLTGGKPS